MSVRIFIYHTVMLLQLNSPMSCITVYLITANIWHLLMCCVANSKEIQIVVYWILYTKFKQNKMSRERWKIFAIVNKIQKRGIVCTYAYKYICILI